MIYFQILSHLPFIKGVRFEESQHHTSRQIYTSIDILDINYSPTAGLGTVGVIGVAGAGGVTARVTSAPPKLTQVPDLTTPPQQAPSQPPHVSQTEADTENSQFLTVHICVLQIFYVFEEFCIRRRKESNENENSGSELKFTFSLFNALLQHFQFAQFSLYSIHVHMIVG